MKVKSKKDNYGTIRWQNEKGQLHRRNGPALIYKAGDSIWYLNGEIHRDGDLPAIQQRINGEIVEEVWYQHGKIHRINGPAIIVYDIDPFPFVTYWYEGAECENVKNDKEWKIWLKAKCMW